MTIRLEPGVFNLPVHELRNGYRSAVYFNRAKQIMSHHPEQSVTMQVFQKGENTVLCGIDEAIAMLRVAAGHYKDSQNVSLFQQYLHARDNIRNVLDFGGSKVWDHYQENTRRFASIQKSLEGLWVPGFDQLEVSALHDGDIVQPWEPVMKIQGPYWLFAHLESVYLGVLARRSKIATNTRRVVDAANGKPVLFFADRFDHFATQGGDGYAAHVGGSTGFATSAMGAWWGEPAMGTMPHALIAAFGGDTVKACEAFHTEYPDVPLVALVDFNNDCVNTARDVLRKFGKDLAGVRLDTSENMVDRSIATDFSDHTFGPVGHYKPTGVNPTLVRKVREMLNLNGGSHVKIIVSGGFNVDKIKAFEADKVPVDTYAVGSSLLKGSIDYTADVVYPVAKKGRREQDGSRLERVV